jgi:hypothetical protein
MAQAHKVDWSEFGIIGNKQGRSPYVMVLPEGLAVVMAEAGCKSAFALITLYAAMHAKFPNPFKVTPNWRARHKLSRHDCRRALEAMERLPAWFKVERAGNKSATISLTPAAKRRLCP